MLSGIALANERLSCNDSRVRRLILWWIIGLALAPAAWAQLEVRLGVERDNFVRHEPVIVDVFIDSNHNRAVILGDAPGWIRFSVRNGRGFPVNQTPGRRLPGGGLFVLSSRKSVVKAFNLAPFFDFSEPGEYTIQASIATKNWAKVRFECPPVKVQVVRAKVLGVLRRGMASVVPGEPPEVRRYTLQTTRVKGKSHLFLRVSDDHEPSFKIYNVEPLGMMVHHAKPRFAQDADGNSHVFFQCHQRQYFYCKIGPLGDLKERKTYFSDKVRPFMYQDVKGVFKVMSGRRVVVDSDFPAPRIRSRKNR